LKKKTVKILFIIIKAIAATIVWIVGFGITSDLFSHSLFSFITPISIIILLICGLILHYNNRIKTLFIWSLSVLFFSLILMPLMIELPDTLRNQEFVSYIGLFVMIFFYIIVYAISTFISTLIVMLVYKFIHKKRKAKKLDKDE